MAFAADDAVQLTWEFQKDKTIYQEMKTSTKQTIKYQGMDTVQNESDTFVFSMTPQEVDKDKNWIILEKLESFQISIDNGGTTTTYGSNKALVGSEFKLAISPAPNFGVRWVDSYDDFAKKLVKANPQMEAGLKIIVGNDRIRQMVSVAFVDFPTKSVKKGYTWTKDMPPNMTALGGFKDVNKFTYEGRDGKLDKIKVDTTFTMTPPTAAASAAVLPFKVKSAKLTSKIFHGTILFDNEKHRMDSMKDKMTLEGKMDLDNGGKLMSVDYAREEKTDVNITDTNPLATPAKK